jgi:hypothetical protein
MKLAPTFQTGSSLQKRVGQCLHSLGIIFCLFLYLLSLAHFFAGKSKLHFEHASSKFMECLKAVQR